MDAVAGERVEMRSLEKLLPFEEAHCVIAMVVGEDKEDVARLADCAASAPIVPRIAVRRFIM